MLMSSHIVFLAIVRAHDMTDKESVRYFKKDLIKMPQGAINLKKWKLSSRVIMQVNMSKKA
jgi:hypothetical protein